MSPESGLSRYVEPESTGPIITWWEILERWALVPLDLQQTYGIDLSDKELLLARPWPWLRARIAALVSEPGTRLQRALRPEQTPVWMLPPNEFRYLVGIAVNQGFNGRVEKP